MDNQKKEVDKILTNGRIITVDKENRIFKKGAIAIKDSNIVGVDHADYIVNNFKSNQMIDLKGALVHPGLINSHNHVSFSLIRCWIPDQYGLLDYIESDIENSFFKSLSKEMEYYSTILTCIEMVLTGTTSFMNIGLELNIESQIKAVEDIGIRGIVSQRIQDMGSPFSFPTKKCLKLLENNIVNYGFRSNKKAWCIGTVYGMDNCSNELMMGAKKIANKFNTILNAHSNFSQYDVDVSIKGSNGMRPIEVYKKIGILDNNTTLVHLNVLSDKELEIIVEKQISAVRCPEMLMRLGFGYSKISKYPEMIKSGINVGLGTDCGNVAMNHADMTKAMYVETLMEKEGRNELPAVSAEDVIKMATIFGAKAMGIEGKLGSIEVGKWADLVIHKIDRPESYPNFDLVGNLVYSMGSKTTRDVMVGGEFIVKDNRLNTVEVQDIYEKVEFLSEKIRKKIGYPHKDRWLVI